MANLYDIALDDISGNLTSLGVHAGKVVLVVNVASKCGLTPQYDGLQRLYRAKRDRGLVVVGFPANNFAGQEPGDNAAIAQFCQSSYGVDFPLYAKISVAGADRHPLYDALVAAHPDCPGADGMRQRLAGYGIVANPAPEVVWNFEKFLLDRHGRVAGRFSPDTAPDDPALVAAIDALLALA